MLFLSKTSWLVVPPRAECFLKGTTLFLIWSKDALIWCPADKK